MASILCFAIVSGVFFLKLPRNSRAKSSQPRLTLYAGVIICLEAKLVNVLDSAYMCQEEPAYLSLAGFSFPLSHDDRSGFPSTAFIPECWYLHALARDEFCNANFRPAFVQFEGAKQSGKITSDKRSLQSVKTTGVWDNELTWILTLFHRFLSN